MDCMAAVALIWNNYEFLLIKRADQEGDPWSGQMALPGGHREPGESCMDTAIRETKEETGLSISVKKSLGIYYTLNGHVSVAAFECTSENREVSPDNEVAKFFWVPYDSLTYENQSYIYSGHVIFGLTYRILNDYFR